MRTSVVLGVVALTLLAFILVFERGSVSTTEREQRKGRVLDTFVRERVTRIEVQRKGVTLVLTRTPDDETTLALAPWKVEKPFSARADSELVDALLGELEWIDPKRTLADLKPEDSSRFGLDKPRYRVTFQAGSSARAERVAFSVGNDSAQADGAYLQVTGKNTAYVAGKTLLAALDHDPADYHSKDLHGGVSIYATRKLVLRGDGAQRVVEKRGDYFWLTAPELSLASDAAVSGIVNALDALKATRYVSDDVARSAELGLSAPTLDLSIDTHSFDDKAKPDAKDKFRDATVRVRVGAACAEHAGESYLAVGDGPVMCAADAELLKLHKSLAELRETRALTLDDMEIHGVRVRAADHELVLQQQGDNWTYQLLVQGHAKLSGAADATAVTQWFKTLRETKALRVEPGSAPTVDAGLASPAVVASFERAKGKGAYLLRLGNAQASEVAASRQDDRSTLWFPQPLSELLSTSVSRFRNLRLLDEPQIELAGVSLTRSAGINETVSKDAAGYHLQGPAPVDCDRSTVDEIARLFSALEALRFVADAPRAEHGLQRPEWTLSLSYQSTGKPARTHTLKIGAAAADGGRYAQLDDDAAVFVVAPVLVDQLKEPLVSRSALATPVEQLLALTIERGASKLRVEPGPAGTGFVIQGASTGDAARAEKLVRALATLRASSVTAYGKVDPKQGWEPPQARLEVRERRGHGEQTHTVLLGPAVSQSGNDGTFARRSDWDVTFVLPPDSVDALLEREPAAVH